MAKAKTSRKPPASMQPPPSAVQLENLEIKDVEAAGRALLAALSPGIPVTVELSRVGAIDTAGVQLLLAFQVEAAKRGIAVEFAAVSAPLEHAFTALGLSGKLHGASPRD